MWVRSSNQCQQVQNGTLTILASCVCGGVLQKMIWGSWSKHQMGRDDCNRMEWTSRRWLGQKWEITKHCRRERIQFAPPWWSLWVDCQRPDDSLPQPNQRIYWKQVQQVTGRKRISLVCVCACVTEWKPNTNPSLQTCTNEASSRGRVSSSELNPQPPTLNTIGKWSIWLGTKMLHIDQTGCPTTHQWTFATTTTTF